MTKPRVCGTCRHWRLTDCGRECRRFPPTWVVGTLSSRGPPTGYDDSCGEWAARDPDDGPPA